MKTIQVTKSQASMLWYCIQNATNTNKVQVIGPERQAHARAALKPIRNMFDRVRPLMNATDDHGEVVKGQDGKPVETWQFIHKDPERYEIVLDDEVLAILKEYWATIPRQLFLLQDDVSDLCVEVDAMLADAKKYEPEAKPVAPALPANGEQKQLEAPATA